MYQIFIIRPGYCTPIIDPALSLMVLILNTLSYHLSNIYVTSSQLRTHISSLFISTSHSNCSVLLCLGLIVLTEAEHGFPLIRRKSDKTLNPGIYNKKYIVTV